MIDSVETEHNCEDMIFALSSEEVKDSDLFKDLQARSCSTEYWLRSLTGYGD